MLVKTNSSYRFVTALVKQKDRYLITQRSAPAALVGLWEFPGARVEPGSSDEAELERALRERLAIDVKVGRLLASRTQKYVGYSVETALYEASMLPGQTPRPQTVADYRWVTAEELEQHRFVPPDQTTTNLLLGIPRESASKREPLKRGSATAPCREWLGPRLETR
jgi:8-oxo-dGTP pyrophosphatase MutT (NUDIX family)